MIDYLAAALEQEEQEERELRVKLELREPLVSLAGETPDGDASRTVIHGETGKAGIGKRLKATEKDTPLPEPGRNEAAQEMEKPLEGRGRSGVTDSVQSKRVTLHERLTPLETTRPWTGVGLDPPLGRRGQELPVPLAAALRRARAGADFVRRERRNLSVTLPEAPVAAGSFSAEELDYAVERDSRRYDGGFFLY